MSAQNSVNLIGRLTKDPEIRYVPGSGNAVAHITIAVDRNYTDQSGQKQADFVNVVCFKKLAENVTNFSGKGRLVAVSGEVRVSKYQAQDGSNRYKTEVYADCVKFLDYAKDKATSGVQPNGMPYGFAEVDEDEDIPF